MSERREFIKKTIAGTAGITIGGMGFSPKSYASIIGANDRLNVSVIGIRSQGGSHIDAFCNMAKSKNVFLKTICDVDENVWPEKVKVIEKALGRKPVTEWDMRKVFADPEIHAVSFATPNFWHALGTIWAAQAGKHVYVEKPASYNVFEGRKMVEASRKYNVRIQTGLQNRSSSNVRAAMKFMHEGGIGEIYMVRGLCLKPRDSFGRAKNSTPPAGLHYDMWLGPVQYRPYNEKKLHYNWHWFWDTGNGDTGNQGPHQFDLARWGLNKNEHPVYIYSTGGVFGIDPDECEQETPNTQSSVFKYSDGKVMQFETRGRYTNGESSLDTRIGNHFYGTDGYLELNGNTWKAFRKREKEPFAGSDIKITNTSGTERQQDPGSLVSTSGGGHHGNFIDAIRSGKDQDLNCDILDGHLSAALPHLANISYRLKRDLKFMGDYEKFAKDPEADMMLTRKYRDPYVIPDEI